MDERRSWRRPLLRGLLILSVVVLILEQTWRHGHDYVFPEKLREVVPGKIYRGAWQKPLPMRYILRGHQIKTVIALAHTPDHPLVIQEKALARELGVRWVHIPIYYDSRQPANRREIADRLEQAAALIGDPAAQPVFFHCHHGVNRASMAQMAYRTLVCGWSLEQAKEEIARLTGWKQTEVGTGLEFMEAFYRNRVVPRRAAQASAPSSTQVAR